LKAIQITKHGGIEVLKCSNIDEPSCPDDKIKIRIKACSINHLDIWVRNGIPGMNLPLPLILGSDASGIVVEIGNKVKSDIRMDDEVIIQPGTYDKDCKMAKIGKENFSKTYGILGETESGLQAEYVILNPLNVYKKPSILSFVESASMPLVFMTSYQMLIERAKLQENEIVLVYGATSGVGMAAIQIAKDIGAKIIATVGNQNKIKYAENLGANYVINHSESNMVEKIKKIAPNGVNVVFEHIGPDTWLNSLRVLSIGGRIVTCGATTGNDVSIDLRHLFMKQQTIMGSTMGSVSTFKKVLEKMNDKVYLPFIDKVYGFKDIREAHLRMENRKHFGKIILIP
tara:strand:- start:8826 stop:9854 length:1029 start_codon:yes stop_codon:yes gene_type:complete